MKRIGGLLLAILGVAFATFGIVRGTTSEDTTTVEVTIPAGESQMAYTAPGVLHLVNDTVDVTLTAPEGEIHWGVGSTRDVEDFIGDASAVKVTGLDDWDSPAYEELPGTTEGIEVLAAVGSEGAWMISGMDMWIESGTGTETVEFSLEPDQSVQQSLIASTTTGQAPDMTLTWDRSLVTANPIPFVVIGILLALIGTLLMISSRQDTSTNRKRAAKRRERREFREAETTAMPRIDNPRADVARTTGGALGAGIMPGVNEALRDRELEAADRLILPEAEVAVDLIGESDRDLEGVIKQTGGALGIGILPGANSAIRDRELQESDRLVIPDPEHTDPENTEPENTEPENTDLGRIESTDGEEQELERNETDAASADVADPDGVVDSEKPDVTDEDKDWRSLWNFSWGSPWTKGDDNNA